jgi:HEAT repeat protein
MNELASAQLLESYLKTNPPPDSSAVRSRYNLQEAIHLLGELRIASALPQLLKLLSDSAHVDAVVQALEEIGDPQAAKPLVDLCQSIVDIEARTTRAQSKQPVIEENLAQSKLYWQILKALGKLPAPDSMALLKQAAHDFAPDKREQSLSSLISCFDINAGILKRKEIMESIKQALADPSSGVRVTALRGAAQIEAHELIDQIVESFDASEISIGKESSQTLALLWSKGYSGSVKSALSAKLERESDIYRRKKISDFLDAQARNVT